MAIVLSFPPRFTTSDYPFGILWPLYCLSFLDLRLLITPLVSCGHCIFCPSLIYDFWLSLLYLVAIVLSFSPRFTTSDYPFGILWPLYCLSFLDLRLLITPLVSCGHCIVCHSSILYCLSFLDFVLYVIPRFTTSDYPFGILWPLHCLSSSIYDFWLLLWYLVAIVLSVLPRFTTFDYPFGILWPLYCLSFFDLVLSVIPRLTTYDYPFGILWPLYCLSFLDLRLLIIPFGILWPLYCLSLLDLRLLIIPFGILWPLYCLSLLDLRLLIIPFVSCGHCIVFPSSIYDFWLSLLYLVAIVLSFTSSIYDFWLPLWYLVAVVLSVLPRLTSSDYPFGILWPLYFLSFLDLRLLITPLVSCGHCIICHSSILYCLSFLDFVLSVLPRFTTNDYPLLSCGHCIVCPSSIYDFWLLLCYLVAILLSVLPRVTTSDYPFGILWSLYCLSLLDFVLFVFPRFTTSDYFFGILWPFYCLSFLELRLLIILLVSCGHCIVCPSSIYDFWLPLWYLVAIVLSVLPRFTTFDYPFCILWPLYCLSFLDLRLLITPLVSCGHCIVCPSSIYDFRLPLWCLVAFILSYLLDLRLLITSLVSCGHCIVCPSSIYDFWILLWYLVAIVFSVLPRFTISVYPFGILWPLYCLSFLDLRLLINSFCILWPLYCLSLLDLRLLIIPFVSCGHCIVFPSSIYDFWLPLWYLVAVVLSVLPRFTTSDYPFGILWPLYFLSFLDLRLLITPLVSCGHCIVCHSSILYCLSFLDFVLYVIPRFTTSDYPFGILWPLHCLSFLDLRLLITPLVSCSHRIVCPSSIYDFWLPLWYLVAIVLSVILRFCIVCHSSINDLWLPFWYLVAIVLFVLPRFTTSDYPFWYLVAIVLSFPPRFTTSDYPFWYLVAIVLSFPPRFTTSDYPVCILWPLYCLSLLDLRLLIIPFVSMAIVLSFTSSIYDFWLPLWYLVAVVLSVLPRLTSSDYPFGILWPLYFLSFLDLRLLITPLVSCGHCIICHSSILYCLSFLDFVLSVLPRFTTSDYSFAILWPFYCLSFLELRLLVTLLVSCGHCIVCPSSIYDFWLPFLYLVAIVLFVRPRFTTSDYPFCILWPLYYLSFIDFVLSVIPRFCIVCPSSIYDLWLSFVILWPLYCLSFLDLRLLITPLLSCGHCIFFPSSI